MISVKDREILRTLAKEVVEIASLDIQKETIKKWKMLNDMKEVRPMVYIFEIPWWEIGRIDEEMFLQTEDEKARKMEEEFRRTLYLWKHVPMDMVVEPYYTVPKCIIHNSNFGPEVERDIVPFDGGVGVPSSHYIPQIRDEADIEKIKTPQIWCDYEEAEKKYEWTSEILNGIMPVKRQGHQAFAFAPWDILVRWCGPEQLLLDLALRPAYIHKLIDRLVSAYCDILDQMVKLNLFSYDEGYYTVGGGLSFTDELPQQDFNPDSVRLCDLWGRAMAQIFSEVSPAMHEEFAIQYEKRYLNRAGLVYYGCCEPLHNKVDIVAKHIPKLRKISMSPWVDIKKGYEATDGRFVFSFKPNPAFLATKGKWDRDSAKRQIQELLDITKGKNVEIILKDISTVYHEPKRLWEWAETVMEIVKQYE
ncbi:MAG: hypothetical protein PHI44_04960 [Candidatus Ratteibacteria bacterium]|nr:hypothetical protein [Candidatus Ratteibacteria bacterium]